MTFRQAMSISLRRAVRCIDRADDLRHAIEQLQNPDGGFRGRGPRSDLYYTLFAMQLLDAFDAPPRDRAALGRYLASFEPADTDMVHLCSLARCLAIQGDEHIDTHPLAERIRQHRSDDGGFAPTPSQSCGTVYATLLGRGGLEDLGQAPGELAFSISVYQLPSGAYRNELDGIATTPATAAAVVLLHHCNYDVSPETIGWLLDRVGDDGAVRVSPLLDMGDLLSTSVAMHALGTMGRVISAQQRASMMGFIEAHRLCGGSYGEYPGDDVPDAEFTFYALLALGELEAMR